MSKPENPSLHPEGRHWVIPAAREQKKIDTVGLELMAGGYVIVSELWCSAPDQCTVGN